MKTLRYAVWIDAPKATVWQAMLGDEGYRVWTRAFAPGSHFVGDWSEGSDIRFLAPNEAGTSMVSRIETCRPYDFVAIEHLGMEEDGVLDTTSERVRAWAGAMETYAFHDVDGGTEVVVHLDTEQSHEPWFDDTWPRALEALKALAEASREE